MMPVLSNFKGSWYRQTMLTLGPLKAWWNGNEKGTALARAYIGFEWRDRRLFYIRFGRPGRKFFAERHQDTPGFPIVWHYYLGGRISVKWGLRR